jgi:hypothetical protein
MRVAWRPHDATTPRNALFWSLLFPDAGQWRCMHFMNATRKWKPQVFMHLISRVSREVNKLTQRARKIRLEGYSRLASSAMHHFGDTHGRRTPSWRFAPPQIRNGWNNPASPPFPPRLYSATLSVEEMILSGGYNG